MIDFHLDYAREAQLWHFILFIFVYLLVFMTNKNLLYKIPGKKCKNKGGTFLFLGFMFLTLAPYTQGDFYHYAEIVQTEFGFAHLEDIYLWFIDFFHNNYLLWRLFFWGGASILVFLTAKRLRVDIRYTFLVLFLCYITYYSYARATVSFAVYFFGLSFLLQPGEGLLKRIGNYSLGIVIIWCAHFFHSSSWALIAMTLIIFLPINKKVLPIYILLVFLFSGVAYNWLIDRLMSVEGDEMLSVAEKFTYSSDTTVDAFSGISAIINYILSFGSFYVPFIIISYYVLFSTIQIDTVTMGLYKLLLAILSVSLVFLFVSDLFLFYYRILYMSVIPLSLLTVHMFSAGIMKGKFYRLCVYWGIASILYWHVYGVYVRLIS